VIPAAGDGPIAHIIPTHIIPIMPTAHTIHIIAIAYIILIPTNITLDNLRMITTPEVRLSKRKLSLMPWRAKRRLNIIISAMR
jgi:hypothetical protein